jgi:hypothetical protein
MTKFCRDLCGRCPQCQAATKEIEAIDAVYAALSDEDRDSLTRRDPDDPRTYALDHKGRP